MKELLSVVKGKIINFRDWFREQPKWIKGLILTPLTIIVVGLIFYILLILGAFGPVPTKSELKRLETDEASIVIASDSTILGKYFIENRTNAAYDDISPFVFQALIATEDERFYSHNGIDYRALGRVFFKTILKQDKASGGGSTIHQQLAKNLFLRKNSGKIGLVLDKFREAIIARRLDKVYTKDEILVLYLNTVPFGSNAFGIRSAARRYFNTTPLHLTVEESATLIGMLKANTTYNPLTKTEKATERRNLVFKNMIQYGALEADQADSLFALPMVVRPIEEGHREGMGRYFRESIRYELDGILKDILKPDGTPYNLYTDGLQIYTAFDPVMQNYAREAVDAHLPVLQKEFYQEWRYEDPWEDESYLFTQLSRAARYSSWEKEGLDSLEIDSLARKPIDMKVFSWSGMRDTMLSPLDSVAYYTTLLHCGMLVTDRQGFVKAWVGGIDFNNFKYDHVKSTRQIGSIVKPIVYAAAMEQGIEPCTFWPNEIRTYPEYDDYRPKNVDGRYGGEFSFAGALNRSINVIAVEVGLQAGLDNVISMAHKLGIKSEIPEEPGICLGGFEASLLEMVQVYGTLANRGKRMTVKTVLYIKDRFGNVIYENRGNIPTRQPDVLSPDIADVMTVLLKGVVERGTGANAKWSYIPQWDPAGKTGTSQDYADGWFMGYTPDLVAGVWIGAETPTIHFRTSYYGQANHTALPIWGQFFKKMDKDPEKRFETFRKKRFEPLTDAQRQLVNCAPGAYPEEELEGEEGEDGEESEEEGIEENLNPSEPAEN